MFVYVGRVAILSRIMFEAGLIEKIFCKDLHVYHENLDKQFKNIMIKNT